MLHEELYREVTSIARMPAWLRDLAIEEMSDGDAALAEAIIKYDWPQWRRRKQILPPGDWRWCLFACGRGWGKTRLASEILRDAAESGAHEHMALAGATFLTLQRDLLLGPSGVLAISPPWFRPEYIFTKSELRYPRHPVTGVRTRVILLSGDKPDRIRGAEVSFMVLDELATWTDPGQGWMNADLILRRGHHPRGIITTTLKRKGGGAGFSRDLLYGRKGDDGKRAQRPDMVVVRGATMENIALDERVRKGFEARFKGTPDEVTELEGGLPQEAEGALWSREIIDQFRVNLIPQGVAIDRVIVSVDPSRSKYGTGDLCGILTMGKGSDGHVYVWADRTTRGAPDQWIGEAVNAVNVDRADQGIYEQNRLGEDNVALLEERARALGQSWKPVTARGTKEQRAEPIASLYKAGRVHHVGELVEAEEEMCGWDPKETKESPNRIDAIVHGVKHLLLSEEAARPPLVAL